jgi:glycosyltransferase involved in cell wall biosynthesis
MKIGVDARPLSYPKTGIAVYLEHLLNHLQDHDNKNCYYLISNAPVHFELKNANWRKVEGRLRVKWLSTAWMQVFAPFFAIKHDLDLFWSPRHHLPMVMPKRVRSVVTIHDMVHRICPDTMPLSHLIVERMLTHRAIMKADRIISVSHSTSSSIRKMHRKDSKKVRTIYHGVPKLSRNSTSQQDLPKNYFLFVGTLEPRKNIERITKAFESIVTKFPDVHLVIAGDKGWKNRKFFQMINSMRPADHVHCKGFLTHDELSSIYSNALCLLYPSIHEGFGLPILEAMSMGIPVITSNLSSMQEIAQEAAIQVDPFDVHSIVSAMDSVLTNNELRASLVSKGFKRLKQFSWKRCCSETLNVFEEAVAS